MTDTAAKTNGQHPPADIQTLLNESIQKIAQGWIDQLTALRENTVALENHLIACVAQTRGSLDRLHQLGEEVAAEAQRGREVCAKLADGIAQITAGA